MNLEGLSDLARDIHRNAIEHGWWETERPTEEIFALIHSEWSEALEEARNDRAMIYYYTCSSMQECSSCDLHEKTLDEPGPWQICKGKPDGVCPGKLKPEGIAVELIDGCIRLIDYLSYLNDFKAEMLSNYLTTQWGIMDYPLTKLICKLHSDTAHLDGYSRLVKVQELHRIVAAVFVWLDERGIDPLKIMQIKHEYNKTRPYKHGKKF